MSSNIQNSIWPNEGGTLGQIKVQIPDGVTTPWPTGDALVGNFVFNKGKLVGFVDTKALIANSSKTTTFPYDYVNISLPSIAEGEMTYNYDQCVYVILNGEVLKGDISSDEELEEINYKYKGCKTVADIIAVDPNYLTNDIVNGVWTEGLGDLEDVTMGEDEGMFRYSNIASLSSDLSSLVIGKNMFYACDYFTTFISDLPSLTNGDHMFGSCYQFTTFSADSNGSPVNLSSLTHAEGMFGSTSLAVFNSDLPNLTYGSQMFGNTKLTSFSIALPKLENGSNMFYNCDNLTTFTSELPNMTHGIQMFISCENLTSFSIALPKLTNGNQMFEDCHNLTTFTPDLPKLTNGWYMFSYTNLSSFSSDLSSLTYGVNMFEQCKKLTTFTSNLSSLTNGDGMFSRCKLNTASVQHIADTINTPLSKGKISIGIGNFTPNSQEEEAFNKIASKNWTVYVGTNGTSGSQWTPTSLIPIDGEEQQTPIPFWAKPVPSDEQHARYVDSEGNFYNILGGNFIYGDNLETYGMFIDEEDAAANMRLTKIEK